MIRVVVLYEQAPDPDAYAAHVEVCRRVPGGTFRHGPVFGAPMGEPPHAYVAEWEFADEEAFRTATAGEEFSATGRDARDRGLPRPAVEFMRLD